MKLPILTVRLRRAVQIGCLACVAGLFAVLMLGIIGSRWISERSFLIEAQTAALEISFPSGGSAWGFDNTTVCVPLNTPKPLGKPGDGLCDDRLYTSEVNKTVTIEWKAGSKARVTLRADGILDIRHNGAGGVADKSEILVKIDDWKLAGVAAFDGDITLGRDPGSGEQGYLLGGRYEIRERYKWGIGPSSIVKTGVFARGEVVEVIELGTGRSSPARGHITPIVRDEQISLMVVAVTRAGNPQLQITYPGVPEPRKVRSTWINSVIANPLLVAVALLLSLSLSVVGMLEKLWGLVGRDGNEAKK
ncbi:hypothetical protein [Roseovarius sp. Pro17]|uniref:hypothetical protein n=1 Tax=Roseovarius sp. Pro17 TaxID=3108175 RepID=UPI002D791E3F|nr:hypothetical protein [Roseovarius sp. Pro17]